MELSNQRKKNIDEAELNVFSELAKYLTYFGVFTAFFGFISLAISWFYSKAFLIEFGFSSFTPNLYSSFEKYPNIGIIYPTFLFSLLLLGYLFGRRDKLKAALPKVFKLIFFLLAFFSTATIITIYRLNTKADVIMSTLMFCNPLFIVVGFMLSNLKYIIKNILVGVNIFYPIFIIYLMLNIIYGSMILGNRQANLIMDCGISDNTNLLLGNNLQFISAVISKDSLLSNIHPISKFQKYVYESSDTTQLQLIIMDEHSYYLFEKTKHGNKSYTVSKDIITQIVYK